jgi:hypothetical protein
MERLSSLVVTAGIFGSKIRSIMAVRRMPRVSSFIARGTRLMSEQLLMRTKKVRSLESAIM